MLEEFHFSCGGKFFTLENTYFVNLESDTTVLCGVSNSGKTTVLLALETACLLIVSGLEQSRRYWLDNEKNERRYELPEWIGTKLSILLERITRSKLAYAYYTKKGTKPIFTVLFVHPTGVFVTFELNGDTSGFSYEMFCSGTSDNFHNLQLDLSAEIACDNRVYSLPIETYLTLKQDRIDDIFEPLVRLVGYNTSLTLVLNILQDFYPSSDLKIERNQKYRCFLLKQIDDHEYYDISEEIPPDDALHISMGELNEPSGNLSGYGAGFAHILKIIVTSLTLQYQTTLGPRLLLLDEPDHSVDRPTLAMLADFFFTRLGPNVQCVVATHAYEIIAHGPRTGNTRVRHFLSDAIVENDVENALNQLHCADTFDLMRYFTRDRITNILLLENDSDYRILCAVISTIGTEEQQKIWTARKKYSIFYNTKRVREGDLRSKRDELNRAFSLQGEDINIFALIDQDIYPSFVLDEESNILTRHCSFYRWKRRCFESYFFDRIDVLDALTSPECEAQPSAILSNKKNLKFWYDKLKEVVSKSMIDSVGRSKKSVDTEKSSSEKGKKEANRPFEVSINEKLGEQGLELSRFGPYQSLIVQLTEKFFSKPSVNEKGDPIHLKWLKEQNIQLCYDNAFHQYILTNLKDVMIKEQHQTNVKEWFQKHGLPDDQSFDTASDQEQRTLFHWCDAHTVIHTLQKKSRSSFLDLENEDVLRDLFKRRLEKISEGNRDTGIEEVREMLSKLFEWLSK